MHIETLVLGDLGTNCYIVSEHRDSHQILIIDPADEPGRLIHAVNGRKIEAVLLTHGHFDHTAALPVLEGLPIYIHEGDAPYLTDGRLGSGGWEADKYVPRPEATCLLKDGDEIKLDGFSLPIRVMHTPGHTPGSCVYMMGDDFFTGDTLFNRGYGRYDLPGGDFKALVRSLRKLLSCAPDARVYPGHGAPTTLQSERGTP